jgi:hypothetical protein
MQMVWYAWNQWPSAHPQVADPAEELTDNLLALLDTAANPAIPLPRT